MKILIVEDEKLLADSLRAMLEGKGFAVEAVYDGETGAEYAETGVYDLLILDVMMPGLDGYQVARQVRARRCGTPILMLTARSSLEDRIEGLNAGADYYLTKPFDTRELLACIGALLRRQGAEVNELSYGNTALDLSSGTLVCGEKQLRLSVALVFVIAAILFTAFTIAAVPFPSWLFFLYAVPVSSIVCIVFTSLWWGILMQGLSITALIWSAGLCIYLSIPSIPYLKLIFVVCAAVQVLITLWELFRYSRTRTWF